MPVQHNTLTGSAVHETKQISTAATSDTGKVITPSAVDAGQGVLRNLVESEISSKTTTLNTIVLNTANSTQHTYCIVPFTGTLTSINVVVDRAIATSDVTLTVRINGSTTTPSTVVLPFTASAAGDDIIVSVTANNVVTPGAVISIQSDGASATTAVAYVTLAFTKA